MQRLLHSFQPVEADADADADANSKTTRVSNRQLPTHLLHYCRIPQIIPPSAVQPHVPANRKNSTHFEETSKPRHTSTIRTTSISATTHLLQREEHTNNRPAQLPSYSNNLDLTVIATASRSRHLHASHPLCRPQLCSTSSFSTYNSGHYHSSQCHQFCTVSLITPLRPFH